jgi:hypothetical protein
MEYTGLHLPSPTTSSMTGKQVRQLRQSHHPHHRLSARDVKKRSIKFLAVCRDPKVVSSVVRSAPDDVIKTICNAALNVQRGGRVALSSAEKSLFRNHGGQIAKLVSKKVSLKSKRKLLSQRGGAFFIPALIGAALGGLGSALFGGNKS